jgi:hypothetical protein
MADHSERRVRVALLVLAAGVICVGIIFVITLLPENKRGDQLFLTESSRYLISIVEAELPKSKGDGSSWDWDNSGPDCFYEIWWRQNRIFSSSPVPDSLLPRWQERDLNLIDVIKTQGDVRTRLNGAEFTPSPGDMVIVVLKDADIVEHELIDKIKVPVNTLKTGDQEIRGTYVRLRVRVLRLENAP